MSYYYVTAAVVDRQTLKQLIQPLRGIVEYATLIDTNRYYIVFEMKYCTNYDEIIEIIKSSTYYEIMQIGEELGDINYTHCDDCEYYIELERNPYYVNNGASVYKRMEEV